MMGKGWSAGMALPERERIARAELAPASPRPTSMNTARSSSRRCCASLDIEIIDGGISTDPNDLVDQAVTTGADFIALSSYNGVALQFFSQLKGELDARNSALPVFIGGKLNRIPDGSNTSLPVDISEELASAGATVCKSVDSMIASLGEMARARGLSSAS